MVGYKEISANDGKLGQNTSRSKNEASAEVDTSNWSPDLVQTYEYVHGKAIEMVEDRGLSKEVSYSIFRDNKYGNLFTIFSIGKDGRVSPITKEKGATLILMGHVHNRVTGGTNNYGFGIKFGNPGPSVDDMAMKRAHPGVIMILHERSVNNPNWKDRKF
jgi:hypothetical protein